MSSFAQLPDDKRRAAVEEGAARLGVLPVIVEKDYWVCWLLGRIFQDWGREGGTSSHASYGRGEHFPLTPTSARA